MLDFWTNETMPSEDSIKVYSEFVSNIQSKEGRVFLAENGKKEGIITTASGYNMKSLLKDLVRNQLIQAL